MIVTGEGPAGRTGLRVVIVTPDIVGPIRNSGIGTAFAALAYALADAGYRVTILYTLGTHSETRNIRYWAEQYRKRGIHLLSLPPHNGIPVLDAPWYRMCAYLVYTWLKEHAKEYDVAYFPEWKGEAYYALLAKRLALHFQRLTFVIVTHGSTVWGESGNFRLPTHIDDVELDFMERQVVELGDWVISPSQYMMDWMRQQLWRLPDRVRVIPNLLPEGPGDHAAPGPHVKDRRCTELVFFGRLEPRKGLKLFCDALDLVKAEGLARLQRITFLGRAVQSGSFDSAAYLAKRSREGGYAVDIRTDLDRDGALTFLEGDGRVAVIPSLVENSPYAVLECLLRGIPFLASVVGGIPELIREEDRAQVLFVPRPAALAVAIMRILREGARVARPALSPDEARARWLALQEELRPPPVLPKVSVTSLPNVSVCVVHHDRPHLLAQALDSLRRQTYSNFEVVLIDDGSSSPMARAYLDSLEPEFRERGWKIVRQENAYLGAARNHAVRHADGEYLLFLDDDDIAKPHEIETFARAALASGADILTTVSDIFSSDKAPVEDAPSERLWVPLGGALGAGLYRNGYGGANALVRRTLFERLGGFTEDYGIAYEDWEFFTRAVLSGARLYLVPEPLFWYRENQRSMRHTADSDASCGRSARPYYLGLPHGLGSALAYALHLYLAEARRVPTIFSAASGERFSLWKRARLGAIALSKGRYWHLRTKFFNTVRQYGWRVAVNRTLNYVYRHAAGNAWH